MNRAIAQPPLLNHLWSLMNPLIAQPLLLIHLQNLLPPHRKLPLTCLTTASRAKNLFTQIFTIDVALILLGKPRL
jgi:hypothetical protein